MASITGGDDRFYNNILAGNGEPPAAAPPTFGGYGLWAYDYREFPLQAGGNVYMWGARPYVRETGQLDLPKSNPRPEIVEGGEHVFLRLNLAPEVRKASTRLVTTEVLEKAIVTGFGYENPDGSALVIDRDYLGKSRDKSAPFPGPFENPGQGDLKLKVW